MTGSSVNNLFPYDDDFWVKSVIKIVRTLNFHWCRFVHLYVCYSVIKCMGQSWYLAADMQMYLISPLLIYPLWRWRRAGKVWMAFVTLAIHVVVYTLYIVHDFLPTMMVTRRFITSFANSSFDNLQKFYFSDLLKTVLILRKTWSSMTSFTSNHGQERLHI